VYFQGTLTILAPPMGIVKSQRDGGRLVRLAASRNVYLLECSGKVRITLLLCM